jgi:NTP pyrophosphatase (non-canonical NTP hydrolase)
MVQTGHTFHDLIEMARKVIAAFDRVERRPWTIEATTIELAKQVGDLARRIMVRERYYLPDRDQRPDYQTSIDGIGDELADILYCLIRIAEHYQIDLEAAHIRARRAEMRYAGQEPDF